MNDLGNLLGGQLPGNIGDLVAKFQQGQHDQVPDEQVANAYGQTAAALPHDDYVAVAEQAFARLSPEQRQEFVQALQNQAGQRGVALPSTPTSSDPSALAQATARIHQQQPNLLQQLFAPGGTFSNPIAKAALLWITAFAAQRLTGHK
jgi:hypothetical protein